MGELNLFLDKIGTSAGALIASFLGAVLSLKWVDKSLGYPERFTMLAGGFLTATFSAPLVVSSLNLNPGVSGGVAFFLGLFSMSLIDAVFQQIRNGELMKAIKARLGL